MARSYISVGAGHVRYGSCWSLPCSTASPGASSPVPGCRKA